MTIDEQTRPKTEKFDQGLTPAEELERIPLYEKGKPPQPLFDIDYLDELEATWGRPWGAQSQIGQLRAVMLQRPTWGQVNSPIVKEDPIYFGWPKGLPNLDSMQRNHESLIKIFADEGIDVYFLDAPDSLPGVYTSELIGHDAPHEAIILNGGALIGRTAIAAKRDINKIIAQRLVEIGCPVLYTVHGRGSAFEGGGNLIFLDEKHVVLGCSVRTSMEGIEEIIPVLRTVGIEEFHIAHLPGYLNFQTERFGGPGGFYHLDMVFNMVDHRLALIYPAGVGYDTVRYLQKMDIELIEVPLEEAQNYACNVTPIRPGRIIATPGNHRTREELEKRGVEVVEMSFEGGEVSGRGPDCSILPLIRDPGPLL